MKVTLIKPHTHAGHDKQPSDVIEVDAVEGAWLEKLGVAQHDTRDTSHDVTHSTIRGRRRDTDRDTREENE